MAVKRKYWKNPEKFQVKCKQWKKDHPSNVAQHKTRDYQIHRDFIRSLKDKPCTDCGIKYPFYIMEFDHRGGKRCNVSGMKGKSILAILEEVAKCDVVCSNCHQSREYHRKVDKGDDAG
jgi:hypothetical protein